MVSRSGVPKMRLAGLERAARYAGESFAYEDLPAAPESQVGRLWWIAAIVAFAALVTLGLR